MHIDHPEPQARPTKLEDMPAMLGASLAVAMSIFFAMWSLG